MLVEDTVCALAENACHTQSIGLSRYWHSKYLCRFLKKGQCAACVLLNSVALTCTDSSITTVNATALIGKPKSQPFAGKKNKAVFQAVLW